MSESHENLLNQFRTEMESVKTTADVEALRVKYLGKKGEVTELLKGLGKLSIEEKKAKGAAINQAKTAIQTSIEERMKELALKELPPTACQKSRLAPLSGVITTNYLRNRCKGTFTPLVLNLFPLGDSTYAT